MPAGSFIAFLESVESGGDTRHAGSGLGSVGPAVWYFAIGIVPGSGPAILDASVSLTSTARAEARVSTCKGV